mmetsp:Transcript_280/g.1297  ORF Transcript_280/g.1297 Transcript_280/m.1297 type:complete len:234 (-) Transcript_280:1246-1947(-)
MCSTLRSGVGSVNSASTSRALPTPGSSTSTTMLPLPYLSRSSVMFTRGSRSIGAVGREELGCTSDLDRSSRLDMPMLAARSSAVARSYLETPPPLGRCGLAIPVPLGNIRRRSRACFSSSESKSADPEPRPLRARYAARARAGADPPSFSFSLSSDSSSESLAGALPENRPPPPPFVSVLPRDPPLEAFSSAAAARRALTRASRAFFSLPSLSARSCWDCVRTGAHPRTASRS